MLVLHAGWLPAADHHAPLFVLWAESSGPTRRPPTGAQRRQGAAQHPFAATEAALRAGLGPADWLTTAKRTAIVVRLPTAGGEPLPSRPFLRAGADEGRPTRRGRRDKRKASAVTLGQWRVPALALAPVDALAGLFSLAGTDDTPEVEVGPDLHFWRQAARLALHTLTGQHFMPALVEHGARYRAVWQPLLDAPEVEPGLAVLAAGMPPAARAAARDANEIEIGPRTLLSDFVASIVDTVARQAADFGRPLKRRTPAEQWLAALAVPDPVLDLPRDFFEQYRRWAHPAAAAGANNFRLCLRLDPPPTPVTSDFFVPNVGATDWALRYFLQARDDPSLLVPAEVVWRERGSTLKYLRRKFDQPQEQLLAGLGLAARLFAPIEASLAAARPEASALTAGQAHTFIRDAALLLQAAGFGVLLPGLSRKLGVRLRLESAAAKRAGKTPQGGVARLAFENVVKFDWTVALGDQALSREEFERLAALKVPLVQVRGQWVEVRPEQLQQAIAFLHEHEAQGELALSEALRLALAPPEIGGLPVVAVEAEGTLAELLGRLGAPGQAVSLPTPAGFSGKLRHYQVAGFSWLAFLQQHGLGACLADDMGLGKTPQTIALLLNSRRAANGKAKPALVVCPTSVVGNWQHELARFAPAMRVLVYHGLERKQISLTRQAAQYDVVITTYPLLARDETPLSDVDWGEVVLDEAQNIKNPSTRQAQAARRLRAAHRVALTGTPIENRLAELWSLFQFLNPGYLGSQASFQATFARPIERLQDPAATQRLKALVGPLILRRVKADPAVIQDLPAKNEMKVFCTLTREQATLYEAVVRASLKQIEAAEGIQRRGLVLSTLLRLKQVCNHPAHFLSDGSALAGRSGKLARLVEMLEEVRAVSERALIFTQFAEMGELLKAHLKTVFGAEALFLHGGTKLKDRQDMIERFQLDPHGPLAFILSIKAGGTGLNLTRANHVFHFDRWWNPAVENQATDRAFRIGQTRSVQVHKFLCAGTVEEKIDALIEQKQALAASIVGTSEAWITELSTEQLRDLFALRGEALG
jgi:SNF2 family DNA or RNA helicase